MSTHTHFDHSQVISEAKATGSGAFLCIEADRTAVRITGGDTLDLLNRLTTMKVDALTAGEVGETLLTNEKGRVIDAALVVVREEDVLLLLSPGRAGEIIAWLEKYTIMEDCVYEDVSASIAQCSVYNIDDLQSVAALRVPAVGSSVVLPIGETTVRVLRHRSVTGAGLRLLCAPEDISAVREYISDHAGVPLVGAAAFALWRIDTLLPAVGHELSGLANPLEAGAAAAVDFEKGCYIGQEVIARLDSYDKVQRVPRRIRRDPEAEQFPEPGSVVYAEGKNAGFVTTLIYDPREGAERGIALVRHAFAAPGTQLSLQPDGDAQPFTVEQAT